jgi:hypothetical protein
MRKRNWVWAPRRVRALPPEDEKAAIVAACDKFVVEFLKPRFLPSIRASEFNCPIDIYESGLAVAIVSLNVSA